MSIKSSVGNCADNNPADVLYIKSLVFAIPENSPGGLDAATRAAITEKSGHCEPLFIRVVFDFQKAAKLGEQASGGRVMPGSKTLALLEALSDNGRALNKTKKGLELQHLIQVKKSYDKSVQEIVDSTHKAAAEAVQIVAPKPGGLGYRYYDRWIGVGVKGGGTVVVAGMEYLTGKVFNLGDLSVGNNFQMLSVRLGVGLGGGVGAVVCLVFNCLNIMNLDETDQDDWGVNIALGPKWDGVVKVLKNYKFFGTLAKFGKHVARLHPSDLESVRNSMAYLYTAYDIANSAGPKLVTIDIPGAGVGAELSVNKTLGKLEILD